MGKPSLENRLYGRSTEGLQLRELLKRIGGLKGSLLSDGEILDTGSALEIRSPDLAGRARVYVHASAPDPEHDPRRFMLPGGAVAHFALYESDRPRLLELGAFSREAWLEVYLWPFGETSEAPSAELRQMGREWFERLIEGWGS